MVNEAKEWVKTAHRSSKTKSGGIFVYIDSETLKDAGIPTDKELIAKRYPTKKGTVILKFKVIE